jgi:hypothetical protein
VNKIGNLALLERRLNHSLGNKSFIDKREVYTESMFELTKRVSAKRTWRVNPASAGWGLLRGLIKQGALVRYHGDFDWPGTAIAGRILAAGARAWRMGAGDYKEAVAAASSADKLPLAGTPGPTPWDPQLATNMSRIGVAVHEEALLDVLLADL